MRVGVDEAGKGPVLGPMVVAAVGVLASEASEGSEGERGEPSGVPTVAGRSDPGRAVREVLPDGVADSKRLAPERRERLAAAIRGDDRIRVGVAAVTVERIDDSETDMNSLTVAGHAEAVGALARACTASDPGPATWSVLADAGDVDADRFASRVRAACAEHPELLGAPGGDGESGSAVGSGADDPTADRGFDVEARHGADDADPVVAAASIVAKVERDARVADLAATYGEVGSGYPSDPATRTFLREYVREHGTLPECARACWRTCEDVLAAAEQSALEDF